MNGKLKTVTAKEHKGLVAYLAFASVCSFEIYLFFQWKNYLEVKRWRRMMRRAEAKGAAADEIVCRMAACQRHKDAWIWR